MPSIAYMNRSAPFWDFVASLEQQGQSHPFFSQSQNNENNERGPGEDHEHPPPAPPFGGPWGWGHLGFGGRGVPHRGPPPPPLHHENAGPAGEMDGEKDAEREKDNGEGPSNSSDNEEHPCGRAAPSGKHGGRCGGRRGRHGFGPYGHGHGPHHHGRGGQGFGGRGGWGSWGGRGGPFGGGPFNPLNFAAGLFGEETKEGEQKDFEPEADIFDTESSFVIHVSLPGAKKEDVGVNWDQEKSELSIAGVIYRPGEEDFIKTLAMDERKVGPFERKIRLGMRANPAQVDSDMITAKLEDGVLRVDVPKIDQGFVEVRKVDIE